MHKQHKTQIMGTCLNIIEALVKGCLDELS